MKRFLLLLLPVLIVSCSSKKNPIVFQKKTDKSEILLILDTAGTFEYTAKSTIGATFDEKGTYTIEDSLLILRFQYESYEQACYEIPLPNDTSLIINYKGKYVLYPTIKNIPEYGLHYQSNDELMRQIVKVYQRKDFEEQVGMRYFSLKSGDFTLLFNGNWKVSPFYDSMLK
ncbi:MAG: hypothetical protein MJ198_04550 [Bacteroidales bacterium]|nr:hypothetical protein [Bacteroidales bacterium]